MTERWVSWTLSGRKKGILTIRKKQKKAYGRRDSLRISKEGMQGSPSCFFPLLAPVNNGYHIEGKTRGRAGSHLWRDLIWASEWQLRQMKIPRPKILWVHVIRNLNTEQLFMLFGMIQLCISKCVCTLKKKLIKLPLLQVIWNWFRMTI